MNPSSVTTASQADARDRLSQVAARARTLALFYLSVLFLATHLPNTLPHGVSNVDKWYHLVGYLILTVSVLLGWELTIGVLKAKHYFAVWLAGVFYAAFDELTQIPVGRTCDMLDWMADVVGILCGIVAFQVWRCWLYAFVDAPETPAMSRP